MVKTIGSEGDKIARKFVKEVGEAVAREVLYYALATLIPQGETYHVVSTKLEEVTK